MPHKGHFINKTDIVVFIFWRPLLQVLPLQLLVHLLLLQGLLQGLLLLPVRQFLLR
jgi:hypothetical protein